MKEFAAYKAPFYTFFSAPFYRDLLKNGKGVGILYLLILSSIFWSMQTAKIFAVMQMGVNGPEVTQFVAQIPVMKTTNGKFSIDKSSPYIIFDEKKGPGIVFDIKGKMKTLADTKGATVLVTEDYLVARKSTGVEESIPWAKFPDFAVTKAMVEDWRGKITPICTAVVWATGIFVWFGHVVLALIYGLVGLIFDKRKVGFRAMMRLAAFAMTPSIIFSVLQELTGFRVPLYALISIIMQIGFMYFGYQAFEKGEEALSAPGLV